MKDCLKHQMHNHQLIQQFVSTNDVCFFVTGVPKHGIEAHGRERSNPGMDLFLPLLVANI